MKMKFEQFLEAIGFSGIAKHTLKTSPHLIKAFSYTKVDAATLKKTLGKALAFSAETGRHVFSVASDKTVMIDVSRHIVVLGNGVDAARILRASVGRKAKP